MGKRTVAEIDREVRNILFNKDALIHQAYFDRNHLLHDEAVEAMSMLAREKLGDEPYNPEVMPRVKSVDWTKPVLNEETEGK
jgi:hypothetical protein